MANHWTREHVLSEIKRRHQKGWRLNVAYMQKNCGKLLRSSEHHYGSWGGAIAAANLDYETIKLRLTISTSAQQLAIKQILAWQKKGHRLNFSLVRKNNPKLYRFGSLQFGSWAKAITAAGIDYYNEVLSESARKAKTWSKKIILQEIRSRDANALIMRKPVNRELMNLHKAATYYFGSWRKAIDQSRHESGYRVRRMNYWTKQKVKAGIRERYRDGKSLTANQWRREDKELFIAARRLFGGRKEAIRAAGLPSHGFETRTYWTRPMVVEGIRLVHAQGHSLASNYVRIHFKNLLRAACKHWGKWRNAVTAAGFNYDQCRKNQATSLWVTSLTQSDTDKIIERTLNIIAQEKKY